MKKENDNFTPLNITKIEKYNKDIKKLKSHNLAMTMTILQAALLAILAIPLSDETLDTFGKILRLIIIPTLVGVTIPVLFVKIIGNIMRIIGLENKISNLKELEDLLKSDDVSQENVMELLNNIFNKPSEYKERGR